MKTLTVWARSVALVFACLLGLSATAVAQETTSSMRGSITTPDGIGVGGATVEIVHLPTRSTRTVVTTGSGSFSARNLRVGGPYIVRVRSDQFRNQTVEDIFIGLGDTYDLTVALERGVDITEEIVVTGVAIGGEGLSYGGGSSYGAEQIANLPSASRDLKDIIRRNPLVSLDPTNEDAFSVAGNNNRFNSVTVDGIKQNDDFGLNNNGYPTQRSPINIDAVEAVTVLTSPYEVTYNGFTGGTVNIVTKSGTNELSGSAYYVRTTNDLYGDTIDGEPNELSEFNEETYGFTLGGPLLRDKLFFFASYDKFEAVGAGVQFGAAGSGRNSEIAEVTQADVDAAQQIMNTVYGFDPLDPADLSNFPQTDEKLLLKMDANITEDHRATLTYQYTNGNTFEERGSSTSSRRLALPSQSYNRGERLEVFNAQLFSDWTPDFSTEIKVGRKTNDTTQAPLAGGDFAQFTISLPSGGSIRLGPDIFRHANALNNETWQIKLKGDYYLDNHLVSGGYEMEDLQIFNLFVVNSEGSYTFNSIADLQNRVASIFSYGNAVTGDENDGAAEFGFTTHSIYLQDEWDVMHNLSLLFGLRYEWINMGDRPTLNPNFQATYGFDNTNSLDGKDILLPRFGFNWDPEWDDRFSIRGGIGLFSGGNPNVWISNTYSNDGVTIVGPDLSGLDPSVYLTNVSGSDIPAAVDATLQPGNGSTNFLFDDFGIPSAWKANLAASYDWEGYLFEAEILVSRVNNTPVWNDLQAQTIIGTSAIDGRALRVPRGRFSSTFDLGIRTRGQGGSETYTLVVSKNFDNLSLDTYLAYAYQDTRELTPGTSSIASSNHGRVAAADREVLTTETSNYEIRHRFVGNLTYEHDFWDDNTTTLSLFFESQSGNPYSFTYNDGNSASIFGNSAEYTRRASNLFYVPQFNGDVVLEGIDQAEFQAFLDETGLSRFAGQIAPRNAFRLPWQTRIDLQFKQEVPAYFEGHKVEFSLTLENFTNFLDSDWGTIVDTPEFWLVRPIVSVSQNAAGQYVYSGFRPADIDVDGDGRASLWGIQFMVKYRF